MSEQQSRKQYVSHSVLNDRYPHGRVEKVTAEGIWLEGGTVWYHFKPGAMRNQTLPRPGSYVVMTEDENHRITHVATQHELQQPPEEQAKQAAEDYLSSVKPSAAPKQLNIALETLGNVDSLVDYRIRTDALALAVQLLNLEAHYGIDRDDIYRVAKEVIRWIQAKGEELS